MAWPPSRGQWRAPGWPRARVASTDLASAQDSMRRSPRPARFAHRAASLTKDCKEGRDSNLRRVVHRQSSAQPHAPLPSRFRSCTAQENSAQAASQAACTRVDPSPVLLFFPTLHLTGFARADLRCFAIQSATGRAGIPLVARREFWTSHCARSTQGLRNWPPSCYAAPLCGKTQAPKFFLPSFLLVKNVKVALATRGVMQGPESKHVEWRKHVRSFRMIGVLNRWQWPLSLTYFTGIIRCW